MSKSNLQLKAWHPCLLPKSGHSPPGRLNHVHQCRPALQGSNSCTRSVCRQGSSPSLFRLLIAGYNGSTQSTSLYFSPVWPRLCFPPQSLLSQGRSRYSACDKIRLKHWTSRSLLPVQCMTDWTKSCVYDILELKFTNKLEEKDNFRIQTAEKAQAEKKRSSSFQFLFTCLPKSRARKFLSKRHSVEKELYCETDIVQKVVLPMSEDECPLGVFISKSEAFASQYHQV